MNKRFLYRMTAGVLCAVMLAGSVATPARAAAPKVSTDETMYANLDYYGNVTDVSVVKGAFLNGNKQLEDYGKYDEVINMSNNVAPQISDGKVVWDLSNEDDAYFYYECKSKDLANQIPWDIDVSYKVNGVDTAGEEVAGADGLVTTLIHVTPKKNVNEYYQNNMILICGAGVDMKECLSLDAPGGQLNSVGTYKAVMFMALPGEESEFRFDVGSHCYENYGIFFMMVPATMDSLSVVNDVREVRDKVEDSVDAMNDAIDVVLNNVAGMKDDFHNLGTGMEQAESAHQIYKQNREGIEADADAAIDSLGNMVTYLELINTQTEADKENLNKTISKLVDMMLAIGGLTSLNNSMDSSLEGLSGAIGNLSEISEATISDENIEVLQSLINGTITDYDTLVLNMVAIGAGKSVSQIQAAIGAMATLNSSVSALNKSSVREAADFILDSTNATTVAAIATATNQSIENLYLYAKATKAYDDIAEQYGQTPVNNTGRIAAGTPVAAAGNSPADIGLNAMLISYISALEELNSKSGETTQQALTNSSALLSAARDALDTTDTIAVVSQDLAKWTDGTVRDDINLLIDQLNDLVDMTGMTLSSLQSTMKTLRSTVELTEDTLSSSLTLTLNSLTGIARGGEGIADGVDIMRNAKDTMKKAIDDELDELDEENNALNIDITQNLVSFTSDKNPTPDSIQIILRTAEIKYDEDADHVADIERPMEDLGVWGRFCKIFTDLWNSIVGIFK